jgi:hypothetical protein
VLVAERDLESAGPAGQGCEQDDLVAGVPVDGGAAVHLHRQLACHVGAESRPGGGGHPGRDVTVIQVGPSEIPHIRAGRMGTITCLR